MENESTDNRNYTTLRDFVARCLRKNKHLSADSLFRTGEEVPLPDLPLKLKDLDSVIDSIFADRFLRLIQDLADYGRRGIYEFEAEEKGPVYEQEERWLNGDLSDLGISPLRGKRSSRPETRMDRESFGSCLARLVKESAAKNLSRRSLEWLTSTFDYNLDWLFFGVGEMVHSTFQSIYEPAQMAHDEEGENGSVTHTVTYQTVADVKGMRGTTTWSGADWTWLLNGKSHTSFQCKAPTLPLAARCVSAWNVQPMTPDMPDLLPFIDRLYVWILHEFFEKKPLPKGDWRQELFLTLVRGKNKLLMLLGTTPQAGTQYRLGKALPGDSARKLAYLIEAIIRRYGRTGFLQYIDMVNDEAVARGFSSLLEVVRRKSWRDDSYRRENFGLPRSRKDREALQAAKSVSGAFSEDAETAQAGSPSDGEKPAAEQSTKAKKKSSASHKAVRQEQKQPAETAEGVAENNVPLNSDSADGEPAAHPAQPRARARVAAARFRRRPRRSERKDWCLWLLSVKPGSGLRTRRGMKTFSSLSAHGIRSYRQNSRPS